jgi:hypothetical protein
LETVRQNIGDCVSSAYSDMTIESATKVLMFQTNDVSESPSKLNLHYRFIFL